MKKKVETEGMYIYIYNIYECVDVFVYRLNGI